MTTLYQQYQDLKAAQPKKYARDLARELAISEAQLTHARVGYDAQQLRNEMREILQALEAVGETKSITRNEYAVHEHIGHYTNLNIGDHAGLVLNPRALDLRLFVNSWHSAFALKEQSPRGARQSLQFFDAHGDAVLKVYTTDQTDVAAWDALIARFVQPDAGELGVIPVVAESLSAAPDAVVIEQEWRAMTDVHQFFRLLKRHNISRQQAFNAVPEDLAVQVSNHSLRQLLEMAKTDGNEIMIFVGNRGCVQIFTGVIEKLLPMDNWLNIFNPQFTLHLIEDAIAASWITRKPTADGLVTSLELFAADGTQIAQLYGQRTEGQPEQMQWRQQLAALSAEGVSA
ncbi:hemin-degrading factor [Erwiniaceae bacterium BAC15a-03b]|uniref:Hemin-degrading factor n=1 Tax=Winslowiella arboricola TaxID=2978220 RepID=A0A9J6PYF4_9GAMM|nr:ChuX/HutX family heme-like substrate-binding protein [Winslowiella arboricola]MCU5774940.1 hemin-degrading factor [Winslowiella arboricola]MCU5779908.1 hemin-degrading factor [Winslowiella arboricola]